MPSCPRESLSYNKGDRGMKVLVVGEYTRDVLESITLARRLGGTPVVLAFGGAADEAEAIARRGVKTYRLGTRRPDAVFKASKEIFENEGIELVIGTSVKNVKDALSRLAGLLDMPMYTEVWEAKIEDGRATLKRGILSEKAYSIERVPLPAVLLFNQRIAEPAGEEGQAEIVDLPVDGLGESTVEFKKKMLSGIKLEEAEIVVGVGRGFKRKEDLKLAFELADLLGGQVGASRPIAADLKWLPEDAWIGISGKRIAPKLYIAVGISGAPQHMAGVMNSKIIVAINKDKSAPVFKQADYGVVADLYEFLPVLIEKIKERKGK